MKNEIISSDWLNKPNELIVKMSAPDAALAYAVLNALDKGAKDALKDKLVKSSINNIIITLPNGVQQEITISRGGTTTKIVKSKAIDYKKAIDFALDHGYKLPMVPQQIIPEHVDETKLENELWFQENIDQFITTKEDIKETKSYNRILIKDVK